MTSPTLSSKTLKTKLIGYVRSVQPYSFIVFFIIVAVIYGYIVYRVNSLSSAQPSETAVSGQVQAAQIPRIDPKIIEQLKSLHDNSVSVQTLFDGDRGNPFQQ